MDLERGVVTGVAIPPPFQISKIKESNIEDSPLEQVEERGEYCLSYPFRLINQRYVYMI